MIPFPLPPVSAITAFRKTGTRCEKCGHMCQGYDGSQGVYCTHETCPAWWTQGPLPNFGRRDPTNELYNMFWLKQNGYPADYPTSQHTVSSSIVA